jgi:hypothetical protein
MELRGARDLLDRQDGVVARRQLVELGATANDLRRWLRRRERVVVHDGVYVNHTGPLRWVNRAWAAVLVCWPAALCGRTAFDLAGDVLHVAVAFDRNLVDRPGIRLHRLTDLDDRVLWNLGPPRVRLEHTIVTLCGQAPTRTAALAIAADACRRRRTTPQRLLAELERRPNVKHRRWLRDVFLETAAGVQSALESAYLRRVERPHGLPWSQRQLTERTEQGVVYRDVDYEAYRLVVELDGRIGHFLNEERWDDMDRDLDLALEERLSIRLGWRHTEDQPCRTAGRVGRLLQLRGWPGTVRPCGPSCRSDVWIGVTG